MTYPQCTEANPCLDCAPAVAEYAKSDEALAELRRALAGDDAPEYPVVLTVYSAHGTVTVENVDESSIRLDAGTLTCEEADPSSSCPLFTFGSVIGYRTTFAR